MEILMGRSVLPEEARKVVDDLFSRFLFRESTSQVYTFFIPDVGTSDEMLGALAASYAQEVMVHPDFREAYSSSGWEDYLEDADQEVNLYRQLKNRALERILEFVRSQEDVRGWIDSL
jgi:hypothetical protein